MSSTKHRKAVGREWRLGFEGDALRMEDGLDSCRKWYRNWTTKFAPGV